MDPKKIAELLAAPFPASDVDWRPGNVRNNRALAMAYIDARAVQKRFDEACGVDGWQSEHTAIGERLISCRIGVRFGDEWVWKSDGTYVGDLDVRDGSGQDDAKGSKAKEEARLEMEGKGAFSTAFKRAAVPWGVGRYLYEVDSVWVDVEKAGYSFKFTDAALRKLDAFADKLYREANAGKAGRMPSRDSNDDTQPNVAPETSKGPSVRGVANAAVEAQVRGTAAHPSAIDPAYEALSKELGDRALSATHDAGNTSEKWYQEIVASDLPPEIKKTPLAKCIYRALTLLGPLPGDPVDSHVSIANEDAPKLDMWRSRAVDAALSEASIARIKAAYNEASARIEGAGKQAA